MLVRNTVCEAPKFKLHPIVAEKSDELGAHSMIPPKVMLIHNIRSFYHYPVQDLKTFEMNEKYSVMCENDDLKPKPKYLEAKGLTHLGFLPKKFQVK